MKNHLLVALIFLVILWSRESSAAQWAIEFNRDVDPELFAAAHGVDYEGTVGILEHIHTFRTIDTIKRTQDHFSEFLHRSKEKRGNSQHVVRWFAEQKPLQREKRYFSRQTRQQHFAITDPLFTQQWHLKGLTYYGLNLQPAWDQGYLGTGVRIAIIDDGVETTHPDLIDNVYLDSSWNFNTNRNSPNPSYLTGLDGDWHGTASAGAAAGRNDGFSCGVGVAPNAQIAGIAILQNNIDVTDAIEAKALSYKNDKNFIYSNSWGPMKPGSEGHPNEGPGVLALQAIKKSILEGRHGLGSIYVWAAGNDGQFADNCNYDGYANMRYAVLIGSTEDTGLLGSYSESCAALLAVTPGGTISARARITTTDLSGLDGKSAGNCTSFAGTSASCPLAAGLIAIMLEVNPSLSWLEVQYVLADSATKHNSDSGWFQNGAGRWVSHKYGWGLLDAAKLVTAAKNFNRKIVEKVWTATNDVQMTVQPSVGVLSSISCPVSMKLHHVEVNVWTSHLDVSAVNIVLRSPAGTESILAQRHDDYLSKWNGWRFLSRLHFGEDSVGTWSLTVKDLTTQAQYALTTWTITLYGAAS